MFNYTAIPYEGWLFYIKDMVKNGYLWIAILLILSCQNYGNMELLDEVPSSLDEISGMQVLIDKHEKLTFIALNDSGNGPYLYSYEQSDEVYKHKVLDAKNKDWEDLALSRNTDGSLSQLFIADTGNNNNDRKSFQIIKIQGTELSRSSESLESTTYPFVYEDMNQVEDGKGIFHDCEAIVVQDDQVFLFTKNRNKKFNGYTTVYSLKIDGTSTVAKLLTRIYIGDKRSNSQITGADINGNQEIALLTHEKVILISGFDKDFRTMNQKTYRLGHDSQKEAIAFINDSTLLIADERRKNTGGNLYRFELNDSFLDVSEK